MPDRAAHYHDNDATPIAGGWACYCTNPDTPDRPMNWRAIRDAALGRRRESEPDDGV